MNENVIDTARRLHYIREAANSSPVSAKLTPAIRAKINQLLIKKGLDGNGRFTKPGQGVTAAAEALSQHGIEMDDISSADRYRQKSGTTSLALAWSNPEDPFSPQSIKNSKLAVQWTELSPNKFEVVAYVS